MSVPYLNQSFDWKDAPLWFHVRGLSETASGYGRKLTSTRMIRIHSETRWRRVYIVCFSNAGTAYVLVQRQPRYLRDTDFSVEPWKGQAQ